MTKSDLTRKHIAATFKDILAEQSYNSITVQSIITQAEVNRKTFYYHFYNKTDLICYIFRKDLSKRLEQAFPAHDLVHDTGTADDKYHDMPFYVHNSLNEFDQSAFFIEFSRYIGDNDEYYRKLSRGEDWTYFETYAESVYMPQIKEVIMKRFDEQEVTPPQDDVDYLTAYYTHSTIHWLLHRHTTKQRHYSATTKENLSNLFYESIYDTVDRQARRIRGENAS